MFGSRDSVHVEMRARCVGRSSCARCSAGLGGLSRREFCTPAALMGGSRCAAARAPRACGGCTCHAHPPCACAPCVCVCACVCRFQRAGHMWKLPMSKSTSEKWQRRLFVAKDGFLMYYAPLSTSVEADPALAHFNTKPKGIIPLGGCKVDVVERGPKGLTSWGLRITHPDFYTGKLLILAAESEAEQKAWLEALTDCSRVYVARPRACSHALACAHASRPCHTLTHARARARGGLAGQWRMRSWVTP
ncbi:hypothetical protein EON67_00755 [archaeon]|nr:MAG: hypothetical protein EON67_00755 [archaeon]